MNLLTQLLLQPVTFAPPPPAAPKPPRRKKSAGRPMSAFDIYRPHMRRRGVLTGAEVAQLAGRSVQTVQNAMLRTLAPRGVVRVIKQHAGRRMFYAYQWIGK